MPQTASSTSSQMLGIICTNDKGMITTVAIDQEHSNLGKDFVYKDLLGMVKLVRKPTPTSLALSARYISNLGFKPSKLPTYNYKPNLIDRNTIEVQSSFLKNQRPVNTYSNNPIEKEGIINNIPYKLGDLIGEGSSGKVHEINLFEGQNSQKFAIKFYYDDEIIPQNLCIIDSSVNDSPYFLKNYGYSNNGSMQIQELADETLSNEIINGITSSAESRAEIFHDIFDGVSFLHSRKYTHGDLKPENMVRHGNRYKVIDLDGIYTPNKPETTPIIASPEILNGKAKLDETDNIYALGISMLIARYKVIDVEYNLSNILERCCNKSIPPSLHDSAEASQIFYRELKKTQVEGVDKELDLILNMINPNPLLRPTIGSVKTAWNAHFPRQNDAKVYLYRLFEKEII